jgi:hypothetical protein
MRTVREFIAFTVAETCQEGFPCLAQIQPFLVRQGSEHAWLIKDLDGGAAVLRRPNHGQSRSFAQRRRCV